MPTADPAPARPRRAHAWRRGAAIAAGVLGVLALLAMLAIARIPSDEALARRAAGALGDALGVPVRVGALRWSLLPAPHVVVDNVSTGQPQAIEVKQLTAWLDTGALWRRRLKVARAEVLGAVLPQASLRGLGGGPAPSAGAALPLPLALDAVPLARLEWQGLTWISRRGIRTVYDGEADFDAGWRPRTARLRRTGAQPAAELALARQAGQDRWTVEAALGGGTANGWVALAPGAQGGLTLSGRLQPRNVEVASALQAFGRRAIVSGRASGETVLSAGGKTPGALAASLHTRTTFSMGRSTLLRFDLDKAIHSLGREHAGQTPLESISGQIDTQATPEGVVTTYSGLKTRSGALSASGQARVANRQIQAELAVDLVDGLVGVPLRLSGPLDKVQVSVPAGALAGAAVGTAVLPGIGTALGARIGGALSRLLGPEPPAGRPRSAPPAR